MAYGVKYELFFSDIEQRKLKIEILEKDFTGDPSAIVGTGQPAVIEWDADDDIYNPIIGSRCKLSFFVTDTATYDEFYRSDERQYKVKILYYNSYGGNWNDELGIWNGMDVIWDAQIGQEYYYQPIWEGFLVVDRYQEAVMTAPYQINLEAIDGLGTLDGFDAPLNISDTSNTESLFYYLKEILKLTGHEFDLYIANGIRKATSPPADETIYHDIEINEYGLFNKNLTFRTAKEVLEQILQVTNARIFQSYGRWYIVSNSNLIDNRIDTSGVIDNISPSGDDNTDDPTEPTSEDTYTTPNITIVGSTSASTAGSFSFTVSNVGSAITSYTWTLPDSSTVTTPYVSFAALIGYDGQTLSVEVSDANSNTDTASVTLSVTEYVPPVEDPEEPQPQYVLKFNVVESLTNAYASPLTATLNYNETQVGDSFNFNINVYSLGGEFTSASQVTTATVTGGYTLTKTLVAEYIQINISGTYPSSGATEEVNLVGSADLKQFTTSYTLLSSVSNSSYSLNPTGLSVTGGEGRPYTMTITYTASSGYEWTGLGNMQILSSANIGQTITSQITSPTTLVVTITGNQGINDQSATLTITGTPIYANPATTITIDPSARFDFTSGGGYFDVSITVDGSFVIVPSHSWITLSVAAGAPDTTTLRVYVEPNNTTSARVGTLIFYPRGSSVPLTTLRFDQESNISAG